MLIKAKLESRLKAASIKSRKRLARKKFFLGMYAEHSGLVLSQEGYMPSPLFIEQLDTIKAFMDEDVSLEPQLYALGRAFFSQPTNNEKNMPFLKGLFGEAWKKQRFMHLVRLGADIENSGLGTLPRPVLVGALLYQNAKLLGAA